METINFQFLLKDKELTVTMGYQEWEKSSSPGVSTPISSIGVACSKETHFY